MTDQSIEVLKKETYIKLLENSPGTRMFNSAFVRFVDTGEKKDILNDGEYSCAFFVTGILSMFGILDEPSATVATTKKKLLEKAWTVVGGESVAGDVLFWEESMFEDGSLNMHVGFALSATEAVSTSYKEKMVVRHDITFNGTRKIDLVLRAPESAFI